MCHLWHIIIYINMFVQIIFLTLMAIDRYLAVVRHGKLMKLASYRNSRPVIGLNRIEINVNKDSVFQLHAAFLPGHLVHYFLIRLGQKLFITMNIVV